jgi:hypothetical protein
LRSVAAPIVFCLTSVAAPIVFCLTYLLTGLACAQAVAEPSDSGRPKIFALVAAFGDQLGFVSEVQSTGSHLSPYRRATARVQNDSLNRIVLHSLDEAIANIHPDSKRIYISLPSARIDGVASSQFESVAIGTIIAALEKLPQRLEWDRIVVAMPAYRALKLHGLAGKLQGFGLFSEPLCQGCGGFEDGAAVRPGGVDALTSEGDTIRAKSYFAPFSYLELWILDPKSLAVLDKQERFDSQKLAEPGYKPPLANIGQYLLRRMVGLIDLSVSQAVTHSELNTRQGTVEVGEPTIVDPIIDRK